MLFLLFPLLAFAASKQEGGFCRAAMDTHLKALDMGSFGRPAADVKKEHNDQFVTFTRGSGRAEIVVHSQKMFGGSEEKLTIRTPSALFPPYEEKEYQLDANCEVKSLELVAAGTAVHLTRRRCDAILKAHKASVARTQGNDLIVNSLKGEYPDHDWAKCENVYSEAVVDACLTEAESFAKANTAPAGEATPPGPGGQTTAQ